VVAQSIARCAISVWLIFIYQIIIYHGESFTKPPTSTPHTAVLVSGYLQGPITRKFYQQSVAFVSMPPHAKSISGDLHYPASHPEYSACTGEERAILHKMLFYCCVQDQCRATMPCATPVNNSAHKRTKPVLSPSTHQPR
jgi:hypothetical protein